MQIMDMTSYQLTWETRIRLCLGKIKMPGNVFALNDVAKSQTPYAYGVGGFSDDLECAYFEFRTNVYGHEKISRERNPINLSILVNTMVFSGLLFKIRTDSKDWRLDEKRCEINR